MENGDLVTTATGREFAVRGVSSLPSAGHADPAYTPLSSEKAGRSSTGGWILLGPLLSSVPQAFRTVSRPG